MRARATLEAARLSTVPEELRQTPRYLLARPIFAIPILPDGSPDETCRAEGFSVDLSSGGIQCDIRGTEQLPTALMLMGVEAADAVLHFATVEVKRRESIPGAIRCGARFVTSDEDPLRPENLLPRFESETKRFEPGLPEHALAKWVELGILRPRLIDRILACPRCRSVPTFRHACRVCSSVHLESPPLIHHFACAHVAHSAEFEQADGLTCPKCRTRKLVVGADYEHLRGPYRCLECEWSDTELELVGECLACEHRFPLHHALDEELTAYDVHRLDPLDLLSAS